MNEEKFTGKADVYDKFRPSYPKELIDILYEKTQAETVADIGAGTGIFTKCLSAKPWKITAVEPNADMLDILKQRASFAEIINAPAENTGIPSGTIDLVVAAQAFHWFDKEKFKAECERILTPGGYLAIVWNNHGKGDFRCERDRVFDKYCGMSNSMKGSTTEGDKLLRNGYFSEMEFLRMDNNMNMNEEQFIGYSLSHSYAIKADNENYEKFVDELRNVFAKFQHNGIVEIPHETTCYLGRFI